MPVKTTLANVSFTVTDNRTVKRDTCKISYKKSDLSRKEIHEATVIPLATVEQIVRKLVSMKVIEQHGEGRATRYRMKIEKERGIK